MQEKTKLDLDSHVLNLHFFCVTQYHVNAKDSYATVLLQRPPLPPHHNHHHL